MKLQFQVNFVDILLTEKVCKLICNCFLIENLSQIYVEQSDSPQVNASEPFLQEPSTSGKKLMRILAIFLIFQMCCLGIIDIFNYDSLGNSVEQDTDTASRANSSKFQTVVNVYISFVTVICKLNNSFRFEFNATCTEFKTRYSRAY